MLNVRQAPALLSLPLVIALVACDAPISATTTLEVNTWWYAGSEKRAQEAVNRLHEQNHPGVLIVDRIDSSSILTRGMTEEHILSGRPPDTFLSNAGSDLARWATVDSVLPDGSAERRSRYIEPLTELFTSTGLAAQLPSPILNALKVGLDDAPYAVPVDIHRLNVMYVNTTGVSDFLRRTGHTKLDLALLCPSDPTSPKLDLKIAMGTDSFAPQLVAFENILVALAGPDFYELLFEGSEPPSKLGGDWTVDVRRALACFRHLSRSFRDPPPPGNWVDAVWAVGMGSADLAIMGDWANGELATFLGSGVVASMAFPGSEQAFVFTSDVFSLPSLAPHPVEVTEFLRTLASADAQLKFSAQKGSLPARQDATVDDLPPWFRKARADFEAPGVKKVLALSGLLPRYYDDAPGLLTKLLALESKPSDADADAGVDATAIADEDAVVEELRAAFPLLRERRMRLALGPAASTSPSP